MVPRMAKSASNCEMAKFWPLQNAQFTGAKLKPKQRISPIKASDMGASQFRLGKTPAKQIANVMQSDGMRLGCGWLLPDGPQAFGSILCGMSAGPVPGGLA